LSFIVTQKNCLSPNESQNRDWIAKTKGGPVRDLSGVHSQVFRPLPDVLRAEAIVDRLSTAISLGLLRRGEQLPVENQLTVMFGVATATVRDALQTLRDQGIIETRRGRSGGTFIVGAPRANVEALRERLLKLSMAELRDLEDEQLATALAAVRLIIGRAFPHDFDRLERIARTMGDATNTESCMRADSRFQSELAVLAQSERLLATQMRLLTESIEIMWTVLAVETDRDRTMNDHLVIVAALRSRDLIAAERAVRQHISRDFYRLIAARLDVLYPIGPANE
jgi:DNA-binding FadR family transcriptional regulator